MRKNIIQVDKKGKKMEINRIRFGIVHDKLPCKKVNIKPMM